MGGAGSGGARSRSGPPKNEQSGRALRAGYTLTALPSQGYSGAVPDFPLPNATDRELDVWAEVWRKPQACAWSLISERWRWDTVALYVRVRVACEDPDVTPARLAQLHRFADQIGLTPAGLALNGWKIATDEVAAKAATKKAAAKKTSARDRVKIVDGGRA